MIDFDTLNWTGLGGLRARLRQIPDPRHRRGIRHAQDQVLLLALAAVVAGKKSLIGISDWLQDLTSDQRALLGCPRWGATYRIPSEPTIRRTLQQVDADEVDTILNTWLTEEDLADRAIAIDGKTLRGSAHGEARPVHLLAGLLHDTGQVIGQVAVGEKTNEIPKLRDLLDPLEIPGDIVTVDALHTQVETARYLVVRNTPIM